MSYKIKQKDVKKLREDYLKRQKGICPLCQLPIAKDKAVLDHDHSSGHIRKVLHRHCNVLEGKLANWYRSYGAPNSVDLHVLLSSIRDYHAADYTDQPLHYLHKTEKDKKIKGLKKRLRQAKRHTTKQRLEAEIRAVMEEDDG